MSLLKGNFFPGLQTQQSCLSQDGNSIYNSPWISFSRMPLLLQTSFRQRSPESRPEAGALHLQLGTQLCTPCSTTLPQSSKEMAELCLHPPVHHPREATGREGMRRDKDSVIPGIAPCSQGCCCCEPSHAQAGCSHTESTELISSYPSPQLSCLKSISQSKRDTSRLNTKTK